MTAEEAIAADDELTDDSKRRLLRLLDGFRRGLVDVDAVRALDVYGVSEARFAALDALLTAYGV